MAVKEEAKKEKTAEEETKKPQRFEDQHEEDPRHRPAVEGHYKPIENYGIIGDFHSAALVGMDGSIDWCCLPHFDSPSIFAAILDTKKGGHFKIAPVGKAVHKQMYLPETCVLMTRFLCPHGIAEVVDFMTLDKAGEKEHLHQIVRMVRMISGEMRFRMECLPAFDYGRVKPKAVLKSEGAVFLSGRTQIGLTTDVTLETVDGGVAAEFVLKAKEEKFFILRHADETHEKIIDAGYDAAAAFQRTVQAWRRWVSGIKYKGRWREMVQRSAMTLKLLTFAPTGAIIASPTTSLPETIGGARNFDYRYMWVRDAAFTVYAFMRLGLSSEAEAFTAFIDARVRESERDGKLQIMYGIHGEHDLKEETLDHLEGYRRSAPVRVGNQAAEQLQLDIYGELMDALYLANKYSKPVSYDLWLHLREILNYVCENWNRKDEGIWEVRGGRHHFVYSKLMCWVALDRGIRLAEKRSFPGERPRWYEVRDAIYEDIMKKGWNADIESFVQHYDTDALDASNLIMPLVFFISPTDPRMLATLKAIRGKLVTDSLVFRYQHTHGASDGFAGKEGAFSMCSFWMVECLTRAGMLNEARLMFEKMHSYANHLGLYSEEIGPTGEHLGNFPQAFTHLSLISAAFNLDRALDKGRYS